MNKQETRELLKTPLPAGIDKYQICSDWLVDLIMNIRKTQYCYNSTAKKAAIEQLGDLSPDELDRLGTLVYNAQGFSRIKQLRQSGYTEATQNALLKIVGHDVDVIQNGSLAGATRMRVRLINGQCYLMKPRAKRKCLASYADNWIKEVQ